MNFAETEIELRAMADVAATLFENDKEELLKKGDAPNGLVYRRYNLSETCSACNGAEHRTVKSHLRELGYDPESVFPISITVLEELRDSLRPDRKKHLLAKALVYAFSNFKGGTAKTTSCITLATGLCTEIYERKLRVGVIDLDPQASLTMLTRPNLTADDFTVGDILLGKYELDEDENFDDFIYDCFLETSTPGLKVFPARPSDRMFEANVARKQFEADLAKSKYRPQDIMKSIVDAVSDKFDVIFIDCSPSFGASVTSAHYVANALMVPVTPSHLDRHSSIAYFEFLSNLYSTVLAGFQHPGYEFVNVLPTAVDETSQSEIQTARKLRQGASSNCFSNNFLYSEAVTKMSSKHQTIYGISKSQYDGAKKTLTRIQEGTFPLVVSIHEQLEKVALKQEAA